VSLVHQVMLDDRSVIAVPGQYMIRVKGRLGATALSAFPSMVATPRGGETVLTGPVEDRSALFGVLGQIEALGLELLEVRQIRATPPLPAPTDPRPSDGRN
jgi:hypothetical protein